MVYLIVAILLLLFFIILFTGLSKNKDYISLTLFNPNQQTDQMAKYFFNDQPILGHAQGKDADNNERPIKNVVYSSSDANVASVSGNVDNELNFTIIKIGVGLATISATGESENGTVVTGTVDLEIITTPTPQANKIELTLDPPPDA